jgi:hypothetical protein
MRNDRDKGAQTGVECLRAHARECEACAAEPPALEAIAAALDQGVAQSRGGGTVAPAVLAAAAPLLAVYAKRAYRKRLVRSYLLTLGPLPLVVAFDAYMLGEAYDVLSRWLPAPMVAWMLVAYAGVLLLLCALTYAALPLLLAPPLAPAPSAATQGQAG